MIPRPGSRTVLGLLMVTATMLFTPVAARGQGAATAKPGTSGWWLGVGGGYVAARADCTNCEEDPPYGNAGGPLIQGGFRVNERMLVGAEIFGAWRRIGGVDYRTSYVLGIAQFRPFATHGFYLKGGYGLSVVRDNLPTGDGDAAVRTWGMGLMYGGGWVFREEHRVSVAALAGHYVATLGDVPTPRGAAENVVSNGWFLGGVLMFR